MDWYRFSGWWQLKLFFIFIPIWGNDPIWRAYFSDGRFNHQLVLVSWLKKTQVPWRYRIPIWVFPREPRNQWGSENVFQFGQKSTPRTVPVNYLNLVIRLILVKDSVDVFLFSLGHNFVDNDLCKELVTSFFDVFFLLILHEETGQQQIRLGFSRRFLRILSSNYYSMPWESTDGSEKASKEAVSKGKDHGIMPSQPTSWNVSKAVSFYPPGK